MMHEEKDDSGEVKPKTIGKLLDEKVCIEGMFTIVLRCIEESGKHLFVTQSSQGAVSKSPIGMFGSLTIDNDLAEVATMGEWKNFTRTTASGAQRLYIEQCDLAYNHVMTGAVGYTQAIKEAVNNVVGDGVTVTYPSGRKDTIETAVARSVRTGVAQATGDISLKRMEEMDWDLVLVSAHIGARTGDGGQNPGNHSFWQGKIYSRSGKSKKFPPFSLTGYGTASGLSGVNCRHSFGASDGEFNPYAELSAQDKANKNN